MIIPRLRRRSASLFIPGLAASILAVCQVVPAQSDAAARAAAESAIRDTIAKYSFDVLAQSAARDDHPVCVETDDKSILFAPGVSAEELAGLAMLRSKSSGNFQTASGWVTTATDGAVGAYEKFTLTYSFVPDGTNIPDRSNPPVFGPSDLFSSFDAAFGSRDAWQNIYREEFARWSALLPIDYVEVGDDGAQGQPGAVGVRGDIRIGGRFVDGESNVLAFNFFPSGSGLGGDMVMDTADASSFANSFNDFRFLRNTVSHEHGHGLALFHVIPVNGTKLMEPFINNGFVGPQEDDTLGARFIYGDSFEADDPTANARVLGTLPVGAVSSTSINIDESVIEKSGESDFFAFTITGSRAVNLELRPVGSTYQQGPQDGSASEFDAMSVLDLAAEILDSESNVIHSINDGGIGESESRSDMSLDDAGDYRVRIFSVSAGDIQGYELDLTVENPDPYPIYLVDSLSISDADGDGFAESGETISLGVTLENVGLVDASGVSATLATTTGTVTPIAFDSTYPDISINNRESNSAPYTFIIDEDHPCGEPLLFEFAISDSEGGQVVSFELETGVPVPVNREFAKTETDKPIDPPTKQTSQIDVTGISELTDLDVQLFITHAYVEDLQIDLIAPNGERIRLVSGVGGSGDDMGTDAIPCTFDDEAGLPIGSGVAPFAGSFQPANPLSELDGINPTGTWTLEVEDTFPGEDSGAIQSWALMIDGEARTCEVNLPTPTATTPPPTTAVPTTTVPTTAVPTTAIPTTITPTPTIAPTTTVPTTTVPTTVVPTTATPTTITPTPTIAPTTAVPTTTVPTTAVPTTTVPTTATPTPTAVADRDGDGRPDDCETSDDSLLADALTQITHIDLPDSDGDGLLDGEESNLGCVSQTGSLVATNPRVADTDGDGFTDGMEFLVLLTDPLNPEEPSQSDPDYADVDGDGLPALFDPDDTNPDFDGDRYRDGYEVQNGFDPADANSKPSLADANNNGVITAADVTLLKQVIQGLFPASADIGNLDTTQNGRLGATDVTREKQYLSDPNRMIP